MSASLELSLGDGWKHGGFGLRVCLGPGKEPSPRGSTNTTVMEVGP